MNTGILIIAHAPLASALRTCVLHVYPEASGGVLALDVAPNEAPDTTRAAAMALLAQLDTRTALQSFGGPQLHLFAGSDALVPAEAARELLNVLPDVEVGLIEDSAHGFLVETPHELACAIKAFLHESGDD